MKIEEHKKQFGSNAEDYTKYRQPYPTELYKLLFSLMPAAGKKVLDVACGTGLSTEPLLTGGLEVFGCDHDPLMIEEAKKQAESKKLNINYSVANVENLPFDDETFDAVTVGTAFHWFVNERSIEEIRRVIKRGGLFFVFWTLTTKDIPKEDEIPSEIFRKYKWDKVPAELRDLDNISKFLQKSRLHKVNTARIPFSYETTVDERVGLQKTASSYELLREESKRHFIDEVRESLTQKLGDRKFFTLEEEIQVCYGYK